MEGGEAENEDPGFSVIKHIRLEWRKIKNQNLERWNMSTTKTCKDVNYGW